MWTPGSWLRGLVEAVNKGKGFASTAGTPFYFRQSVLVWLFGLESHGPLLALLSNESAASEAFCSIYPSVGSLETSLFSPVCCFVLGPGFDSDLPSCPTQPAGEERYKPSSSVAK